jgi:hypothetical protein
MKKLLTVFFLFGFLFFNNCSKNEKIEITNISDDKIEDQMIKVYQEGMDAFKNGDYTLKLQRNLMKQKFYFLNLNGHQDLL